jgi:hypothetical protein
MKLACGLQLVGQLGPLTVNWRPGGLTNLIGPGTPRYNVYSIMIWVLRVKLKICGLLGIEIPQFNRIYQCESISRELGSNPRNASRPIRKPGNGPRTPIPIPSASLSPR